MMKLSGFALNFQYLCSYLSNTVSFFFKQILYALFRLYRIILRHFNTFFVELLYFMLFSVFGFIVLKTLNPKTSFKPRDLDLFFTSVSAITVSSMSTVEMEVLSNPQLVVITVLMFIGSEVFTSMIGLFLRIHDFGFRDIEAKVAFVSSSDRSHDQKVFDYTYSEDPELQLPKIEQQESVEFGKSSSQEYSSSNSNDLMFSSMRLLAFIILAYIVTIHVLGVTLVSLYFAVSSTARKVLESKKLDSFIFSVFTVISTFASCGFVPTNENMIVFRQNSGLLLILIPQVLLGNTLYPPFLRASIAAISKVLKVQREKSEYILKNFGEIKYIHLFSSLRCSLIAITALGFVLIQFVIFCAMEWNSSSLRGLNSYQKIVGSLFMSVNSRHTGETTVDMSVVSPAVLVLFIVMMYLPPYTSFFPIKYDEQRSSIKGKTEERFVDNMIMSQLSYLTIFVIFICITERENLREDPINFTVINIILEVVSAYGNVGFTTGYSCGRRVKRDGFCEDKWFGFVGRWSNQGKAILIVVMFFGRLKKFNMRGGKPWKLL